MKIKISRNKFREILKIAGTVCSSNSINLLLECILIEADKEKNTISCTFLNNILKVNYLTDKDVEVIESGTVLSNVKTLDSIISKLPESELTIEKIDTKSLRIEKTNFVSNINILDETLFIPIDFEIKQNLESFKLNSSIFRQIKNKIFHSCLSKNENNTSILSGIYFDTKQNDHEIDIISTDSFRISKLTEKFTSDIKTSFIFEPEIIEFIDSNIKEETDVNFYIDNSHVYFKINELTIISKLKDGSYPNVYYVLNTQNANASFEINAKTIYDVVDRGAFIVSSNKLHAVTLSMINNDELIINFKSEEVGDICETIKISNFIGTPISKIVFNSKYLLQTFKSFGESDIRISFFNDDIKKIIIFEDLNNKNYKQLVLPLRT